jgi:hypothetical protein
MNRTIKRLNSVVKTNDILYFLGDFCIGHKQGQWSYAARLDARRYTLCQATMGIIRLTVPGICTDTRTGDCPASMHHLRWMSAWTPMIFVRGTSIKSEIE